jgi:hypothetical protein
MALWETGRNFGVGNRYGIIFSYTSYLPFHDSCIYLCGYRGKDYLSFSASRDLLFCQ